MWFRTSEAVVLDASGDGSIAIQPPGVDWLIVGLSWRTSTAVLIPELSMYSNTVADANFVGGSYDGSRGQARGEQRLRASETLLARWTGGDVGATATIIIEGQQYPRGQLDRA